MRAPRRATVKGRVKRIAAKRAVPAESAYAVPGSTGIALLNILAALGNVLGARRSAGFVLDDRLGFYRVAVTIGLSGEARDALDNLVSDLAASLPYAQRLARERHAVYLGEPSPESLPPAWVERFPFRSHLAVPLLSSEDELIGTLCLEIEEPGPAQCELAEAMGRAAAAVIEGSGLAQTYAEETRRSQALLDMFQQMNSSVALPEVLAAICHRTVEAFGVSCATIFDLSRGMEEFVQIASEGIAPDLAERFLRFHYTAGTIPDAEEFLAGRTVLVSRGNDIPRQRMIWLDGLKLHTAVLFPLRTGDTLHGCLAVGIREQREFTPAQILGLEVVAHHAATAMVLAGFLRNAESAARFRAAVSALAVELNAEIDRARALQLLCARGRAIFRAAWGALFFSGGDRLIEIAADGEVSADAEALSVSLSDTERPVARAFLSGDVVLVDHRERGRNVLAVPLAGSEGVLGVLVFRDLRDAASMGAGVPGDARILGALAAAVLRNLELMTRLHRVNSELRRANTLKDQLLANASHDLRTPLNVIIGYGQLALEGSFGAAPAELRQVIQRMVNSACDQLSLVEDLLDLSRIELNILSVKPHDIPLAPLFAEMDFVAAGLVQHRPVRAIVYPVSRDVWVYADTDRLRQILTNLLSNAAKFTDEGRIELWAVPDDVRVRIGVRDTGIGIPPEHHRAIFEPFAQFCDERAQSGAGLGLAIARRLAQMMRGTLTVESTLGKGSTFWLTLPAGNPTSRGTGEEKKGEDTGPPVDS